LREAVIDTNVLVYDTFEDSVYHESASKLLDDLDRWLVPLISIYEYIWLLKGLSISLVDAKEKLLEYTTCEKFRIVKEDLEDIRWAISILEEENLSLARFNDKVILSIAFHRGVPLATYDIKLRKQAIKLELPVIPELPQST